MKTILSLSAAAFFAASTAQAALVANISGIPGSGQTTWTFSGVAIAVGSGFFEDGNDLANNDTWRNFGEYTSINDFENFNVLGDAGLTIDGMTRLIDLAYINDGAGGAPDDWGVGVEGDTDFEFFAGFEISWTNSLTVIGCDINDLNNSGLPISFLTSNYGSNGDGTRDLELTIAAADIAPVPMPATT
ncbi:hypothetical protein [uncultured Roseobacter sp.]|uniref:hypothetical protein n=1 Tax=uncultured Roseobacter sp. TaxID=114847 RepID=UPI002607D914|nr:hypothetical protein [uncultured Roseobacter sp.]